MTILSKFEDHYLGDKQIKFIETAEPSKSGVELVAVVFNDGSREQYSKKMIEQEGVVTPQIQDLTQFRDARVLPAVTEILKVLRDYNVKLEEIDYLVQKAMTSINMNLQEAEAKFWGVQRLGQQTMVQVDDLLLSQTLEDVLPPVDNSGN